jgi:hypothetical protein
MVVVLIFTALAVIARSIGALQPPNPALRGFIEGCEDKPQPCWYGIVPGVTIAKEAQKILEGLGYAVASTDAEEIYLVSDHSAFCRGVDIEYSQNEAGITLLLFRQCSNFVLGDLLSLALPKQIAGSYGKLSIITLKLYQLVRT